jgi:hypothetical protein
MAWSKQQQIHWTDGYHGQSIDWILCGYPSVMVCKAGAQSMTVDAELIGSLSN